MNIFLWTLVAIFSIHFAFGFCIQLRIQKLIVKQCWICGSLHIWDAPIVKVLISQSVRHRRCNKLLHLKLLQIQM